MCSKKQAAPGFSALSGIAVCADDITVIETAREFKAVLLGLIKAAKKRIYITALYLQDDASGREILTAIYEAKSSNPALDVKIFVDFLRAQRGLVGQAETIGNVRLYRELAEKYDCAVDILGVPVKTKEVLGVLHLKGFIFDNTVLYTGASLNDIYLQRTQRYRYDRYHLLESKALSDCLVNYLCDNFLSSNVVRDLTQQNIPTKKQLKSVIKQFKGKLRSADYQFEGVGDAFNEREVSITPLIGFGGKNNQLNETIYQLVKNTKQCLRIFTPYFNLPNKISKSIRRILKNGRQVDIVVGDKAANDFFITDKESFCKIGIVPYLYEANLRKFVKRNQKYIQSGILNVYLWLHHDNSFHLKGISCDERYHLLTGHNINPRAWQLDLENGLLIQDPRGLLKEKFGSEYRQIIQRARRIQHYSQIETIKDYPEAPARLMKTVSRAKLDSILNRLL